jgi:glycosyltransferase involved in cell wall biosynthesis
MASPDTMSAVRSSEGSNQQPRTIIAPQVCLEYVQASGGSVTSVRDFARALDSRIITFIAERTLAKLSVRDPGVTYIPVKDSGAGAAYSWTRSAERAIAEHAIRQADLVVCHLLYRYHVEWAVGVAREAGIPYWIVPHGALDPYVFTYRAWRKRLWLRVRGRRIFREAAAVVFATQREREKAARYVNTDRCKVIHWAVPSVPSGDEKTTRARVRCQYGIPEGHRVLLFMGRLHELKRPLELIRLMAAVADPTLHLLIVGPEETITEDACRDLVDRLGVRNVHVVGPVYGERKYEYFFAADAYVSLSHRENFGFTVAEALSCGCPVILGPGVDLGADLEGVGCGWVLARATDDAELAAVREFASVDDDILQRMGAKGRAWVGSHLTYERFAADVCNLALATTAPAQ